jgi:hypothetical protein
VCIGLGGLEVDRQLDPARKLDRRNPMRPAPGMISSATSTSLQAAQAINEGEVHVLLRTQPQECEVGGASAAPATACRTTQR